MHNEIRTCVNSYGVKLKRPVDSTPKDYKFQLTAKQELELMKETEYEFERRQGWKRIFPTVEYQYYKQFFVQERPLNAWMDQRVMSRRRLGTETSSVLQQRQQDSK